MLILRSLRDGFNAGQVCSNAQVTCRHWGEFRVFESSKPGVPSPIERLASTLAGIPMVFEAAIISDGDGTHFCLGFETASSLERARRILAPGCRLEPTETIPQLGRHPYQYGITHRVQAADGTPSAQPESFQTLLDKLESIGETWTVFLRCETVPFRHVRQTTSQLDALAEEAASFLSVSEQVTDTRTATAVSHRWARIQNWIAIIAKLVSEGVGTGLWTVDTWVLAPDSDTLQSVAGALHASFISNEGRWYETLAHRPQPGPDEPPPTSVLTSKDLGSLLSAPRAGQPGLGVRHSPPTGRRPSVGATAITMGTYLGTTISSSISLEDIEGHGFVTGTTGSGKSTTLRRLLAVLWNTHHIPFLVLDPVKDDYTDVAQHFRGGIQLVRGADIHLNLLEPWPHADPRNHIAQVSSAFRGAFSMPSPTPYVVTQLFDQVAMLPSSGKGMSLFDVRDMVPQLISSLGYAPEQESNIRAALMTRLNLLLSPTRAHRFSWTDSSMVSELFKRPTVVTLGDLGDDEERSFVVLLLALATWAHAKARKSPKPVEHVLVLEEAHRILPEVDERNVDPEVGSAKQVSASMLSSMMAEVRSYGEQLLVVDQSPSKVSTEVSRNTNLKIVHRVVHPQDQQQVAGALGLPEEDASLLGELDRGTAIYTTRTEPGAQTIQVDGINHLTRFENGRVIRLATPPPEWPCCAKDVAAHYRAWQLGSKAAGPMALFLAGLAWGNGDGIRLRKHICQELLTLADGQETLINCLAWSGLRQLTSQRRKTTAKSADNSLGSLYGIWSSGEAIVSSKPSPDAADWRSASETSLTADHCAIASAIVESGPRDGLRSLRAASWRQALISKNGIEDYLKNYLSAHTPFLGDGAKTLVRTLILHATQSAELSSEVADQLLQQTGVSAK